MSTELILKDLLIRPRTCVALTATLWQCEDGFRSLVHHTPKSSSFTISRSVDTFAVQSFIVQDTGSECFTVLSNKINIVINC